MVDVVLLANHLDECTEVVTRSRTPRSDSFSQQPLQLRQRHATRTLPAVLTICSDGAVGPVVLVRGQVLGCVTSLVIRVGAVEIDSVDHD